MLDYDDTGKRSNELKDKTVSLRITMGDRALALTGNVHGEGVFTDSDQVEGDTLHGHPMAGRFHCQDALDLDRSILLPLDLDCLGQERSRHLETCCVLIAPVP
jgi:hypothetical protein